MAAIYLTSSVGGTGRTCVAAGLARALLNQNKKVGYLKPLLSGDIMNDDAELMRHYLALEESLDTISPAFGDENELRDGIRAAYDTVSSGKDVVLVEGAPGRRLMAAEIGEILNAKIIGVESYSEGASTSPYYEAVGKRVSGVIMNRVPASRQSRLRAQSSVGPALLGVVPEERSVTSLTVGELAHEIKGEIVSGSENSSDLIEHIMLGAMNPDHGPEYYHLKDRKAVIVRSERPDMQLAALDSPTACLVLAGGGRPATMVSMRAEARKVPIVLAKESVAKIVADVEAALRDIRLTDVRLARIADTIAMSIEPAVLTP